MATAKEHVRVLEEWVSEEEEDDDESGSDMEFGEFDLSGARNLQDQQTFAGYEDDDDADECGAQFSVRLYRGGAIARNLQLSGFEAHSDGPELTEQHELTSYDMRHLVHLALEGGENENMEDDEAALAGAARPCSRVARAAMVGQALQQSANQQQQQSKSPTQIFPMRTGH